MNISSRFIWPFAQLLSFTPGFSLGSKLIFRSRWTVSTLSSLSELVHGFSSDKPLKRLDSLAEATTPKLKLGKNERNLARGPLALFLILVCLLTGSCTGAKQIGKTLGDLVAVRAELIKRFGEDNVDVRIQSSKSSVTIWVTFTNSPLNESAEDKRSERAKQTAEIVKTHYPDIKSINYIGVNFVRANSFLGIFHSNRSIDFYWFDRDAKPLRETDGGERDATPNSYTPKDPLEPQVSYTPSRNETEIYLEGIQLEGTPEKGLMMIPRIMVQGNTSKTTPAPPEMMSFDFASFADKPQFPGKTKITFFCDKKSLDYEGEFAASVASDGLASEFLYLKIPYSDFKQIVGSEEVTVRLGKKKFALTRQQIHALLSLTRFIKE